MIASTQAEIDALHRIGQIVGHTLKHMLAQAEPGMTTRQLDALGAAFLQRHNAQSAPILAYQFPGYTCISLNDEAAHGIPSSRVIRPGDVLNVDVSAMLEGYWADTGASIIVPPAAPQAQRLLKDTRAALYDGIAAARAGQPVFAIGRSIEAAAKRGRYSIIRDLAGHGVGGFIHEPPDVYNYLTRRVRDVLPVGQVMTVEPFFSLGRGRIYTEKDGWTLRTLDHAISAQFEHTILVREGEALLLTHVEGGH